jgi:hypothetical protein
MVPRLMAEIVGGNLFQQNMAALGKKIKSAKGVKIGFLDGATYPDGMSVAQVALINNFGAPSKGIPPRPFFSNMVKRNSASWPGMLAKIIKANDGDVEKSLKLLGVAIEGELRDAIIATVAPPNSPVTNLLKQRFPTGGQTFADVLKAHYDVAHGVTAPAGKPLVQSGTLLASISSEVE